MTPKIFSLTHNDITIEYSPERGGLVTQIYFGEKPVLFLNEETFYDLTKNVRGGIPIMFPNSGPIKNTSPSFEGDGGGVIFHLPQHGFARNRVFSHQVFENSLEMKLTSDDQTRELFPYDFELTLHAEIIAKSVQISLLIKNTGDKNMPIAPGLHPYFFIPENQKDNFFLEKNGNKIEEYKKYEGETIYTLNPGVFQAYLGENILDLEYSENFQKLWLRSESGKDFLCIEPAFGDEGALIDDPCILLPNQEKIFSMTIKKQ